MKTISEGNNVQMIKSFIYLDEYKMYSISSQIFEGITEYLIDSRRDTKEDEEMQKGPVGSGRIMADILKSESKTEEKKYLHDYSYKLFEDSLKESEKILSISAENIDEAIKKVSNAKFVKIRSKAIFNDMNIIKSTIEEFNELGKALTYITNFKEIGKVREQLEKAAENIKDRNKRAELRRRLKGLTNIKELAKEQGLSLDPDFLKNLSSLLEYGFQDQFEVQMPIGQYIFSSNFNREYLRENEDLLIRKYSRFTEKKFVLLGTIAQSSNTPIDHEADDEVGEFEHLKEGLMRLVEQLWRVESTFLGKLVNEIIVDPIALYREI